MTLVALFAASLMLAVDPTPTPSPSDVTCVTVVAYLGGTSVVCTESGNSAVAEVAAPPSNEVTKYVVVCGTEQTATMCEGLMSCVDPPGSVWHAIYHSVDYGKTFAYTGGTCRLVDEETPVVTPGAVATAFESLTWPESPLQIQPVGGRTLVNLPTNFFTTNTAPTSQTITLLGQEIEIEATPTTWTWRHGDHTTQDTSVPGTPYPELTITHTYLRASEGVSPSVDTTYTGRYRLAGGPWQQIPATHTVPGTPADLEILTARPQLIGSD